VSPEPTPGRDPEAAGAGGGEPPAEAPLHASLRPSGEAVAWSALGSLLAGPIVWGGLGFLLDRHFGTGRLLTAIGVVVGSLTAFYIVYLRFGRDDQ
jgi:F0F1-type ATP synthase assembly protein I